MSIRSYYADATFTDFLGDLWRARLHLLVGGVAGLLGALQFLFMAVPHTRAMMIVAPATVSATVDAQGTDVAFDRFEATLRGPSVAASIFADQSLRDGVAADRRWRIGKAVPVDSAADIASYLEKHVEILPVGSTLLRRVRYAHPDARFAVTLLAALGTAADSAIRDDVRTQVTQRAAYLQNTLSQTTNPDYRRHLTDLLNDEQKARLDLAQDRPYAAILAEAPAAEGRPHWPRAGFVLPVMVMMGLFFGFALFNLRRSA